MQAPIYFQAGTGSQEAPGKCKNIIIPTFWLNMDIDWLQCGNKSDKR
jgi:hypothetical protein